MDHNKLWEILQMMEYQTFLPASWEIRMQVKKQQLELDMEQWTGSKLGKEYVKAVIWITSDMQMTLPLWHKVKKN